VARTSLALPQDDEFFERELAHFLPDHIYDAHCHLWRADCVHWNLAGQGDIDLARYQDLIQDIHHRPTKSLFLPFVTPDSKSLAVACSEWVSEAGAADRDNRGLFFVKPEDDPEWVRQEVRRLGLHGLKCYHTMAASNPTWEAGIEEFLPEPLLQVAHEEEWVITLHMVKSRAVADPANIAWIRSYCEKYPDMRLILAHSARGFQPAHNLEGLEHLKGLDNLYFDTSANCEPIAHQAIMRIIGHDKLMYGSDLPVSHERGRSLSAADSFLWIYESTPVWGEKHSAVLPVLVGLEHLRSLKWACWSERLSDNQIEDIFWNNAARLLNV